jgi:hypothetical protein
VAGRDIWNKSVGSPRYGPCDKPTDGRQADDRLTDRLTDRTDRTEQTEQTHVATTGGGVSPFPGPHMDPG